MLGEDGLLPPGRHTVTIDEFEQHFVTAFAGSTTRSRLFLRWRRHREALSSVVPIVSQWVDGSYVTAKLNPNDIDVVTLIDAVRYDVLAPALQQMVNSLLAGKETQRFWTVDSYPLPVYPVGHTLSTETDKGVAYWDEWWQRVKDDDGAKKGYLEVKA